MAGVTAPPPARPGRPVVVVGDVGVDVLTRPHGPVPDGGESTADVRLTPGGAGANTAVWLAAAGASVTLLSRVGDDVAGDAARRALEDAGVGCRLTVDPVRPTCTVVVLVDARGGRTMLSDRGAVAALAPQDVRLPEGEGHLHVSGYVLLSPGSRAAGLAALAEARERGWTTSVDPQSAEQVRAVGVDTFLGWVDGVDLLLPNEIELDALGEAVLDRVGAVAATYGAGGARWLARGAVPEHVAAPAVTCTDSTGCGDAFDAGLLVAWVAGRTPRECLEAGVATGSRAATAPGARP